MAVLFVVGVALGAFEATLDTLSGQPATAEILALSFLLLGATAYVAARRVGQVRRERSLRGEAEARFRTMLQRLPVVAFTTDYEPVTGVVHDRWIAPGIERLVGVEDEAWLAETDPWVARAHPDDRERVLGAWRAMAATGGTFAEEYRLRRADGTWVWVREETSAVLRGGRLRCDGVFIDISAQRAAERARVDAEERFRTLVEQLPAVTYIEEPETGRNLYISPQIEAIYGVPPEAWLADPHLWETRLHPEDRDRVLAENAAIEADEWTSEYRSIDRDGATIWLHNAARLVRDEDGEPRFWLGIVSDVTERRAAEQQLRDAEERYRHLVEQMPVAVYTDAVDELSTAVYISPRYEELTGYSPEERLADPGLWAAILHPDDRERVLTESERTNVTGDPFDMEYRVIRKDGGIAWLHDHASLVTGPDGVPIWQGVPAGRDPAARRRRRPRSPGRDPGGDGVRRGAVPGGGVLARSPRRGPRPAGDRGGRRPRVRATPRP